MCLSDSPLLLQLGKLQIKTEQRDKRENLFSSSLFGTTNLTQNQASILATSVRKVKNRSGLIEKRPVTCLECGEEFCFTRGCSDFNYDMFVRVPVNPTTSNAAIGIKSGGAAGGGLGKSRRKKKGSSPDRSVAKKKPGNNKGKFKRHETKDTKEKKKDMKPKRKSSPSKKKKT